ncbi:MAG: phenylalanine--tRNA ligase subunit beta [Candidatus Gastranaerophilales bacterium]|nr:phenylalanine--tRNA ligase subunit beta [Candidatus Gastranaerophilales bacterium]
MLISLEWLNEFVDLSDKKPEEIAEALTMSGLEVEDIEKTGAKFTNIVTAEIKAIANHPDSDHLHLVTIDNGTATRTVVCGAQNIAVGQIIPYASVGSKVLNRKTGEQFELTPAKIRGVVSEGMLCSQDELGLEKLQEEDGILVLNRLFDRVELGMPLEKLFNINEDIVFNVAPTANRGDEMSVIGVARELSAIYKRKLNFSPLEPVQEYSNAGFEVEIKDEDTCTYYSAGILEDLKVKPSPDWMKRRLEACGIRSINNIVDITNYVLLEYGQPLHSFDKDKLNGYLCVRRANEGETIVTLDEVERKLTHDTVLIATKEAPVCVGGVFGGNNSGIDDNTKNIVLEAAYFTPACNRKSARSIGYRSEASARFERGVDIDKVKPALFRAIQLLVELADAKVVGIAETGSNKLPEIEITLRFSQINKVMGIEINPDETVDILERLGFTMTGRNQMAAKFLVPGARRADVYREIDLIEEVARIYSYDKVEATLPKNTMAPEITYEAKVREKIENLFLGHGFYEAMSSSLIGEPLLNKFGLKYDKEQAVKVKNAQSEDHTMLRQTLIVNMLEAFKSNYDNGNKDIRLFEIGKTYFATEAPTRENSGVQERLMLSGILTGNVEKGIWKTKSEVDFYTLKGVLESLFDMLGLGERIKLSLCEDVSYLHPGRSANVSLLAKGNPKIGVFGEVHPILTEKLKSNQKIYIFEFDLETILKEVPQNVIKFKRLPQFPEIQRDIAFSINDDATYEKISAAIKKSADNKLFKNLELFDIYKGEHIEKGFKSMAFRIKLQNAEATLTDEIIDAEMDKIRAGIKKAFPQANFR